MKSGPGGTQMLKHCCLCHLTNAAASLDDLAKDSKRSLKQKVRKVWGWT